MRIPSVITIDFETEGIEPHPEYPPVPVGVAIKYPGRKSKYLAWGHPIENNCTKAQAIRELKVAWNDKRPKLFHHGKFDIDVGVDHMGMKMLPWEEYHDTEFLAFLHNPHSQFLKLKVLSDEHLGMAPEEQDELNEWILSHVFTSFSGGKGSVIVTDKKPKGFFKIPPSKAGGFISYTPGKLCGRYACGDTDRTHGLFKFYYPYIIEHGMNVAYERERRLMPVLLKSEKSGTMIHHRKLKKDVKDWEKSIETTDEWIRRRLKTKELNVDKAEELADAIENCGKVTDWVLTKKGNRSVAKDNLIQCIDDKTLVDVLGYRSKIVNALRNFGRPWMRMADATDGYINTNWNQVRSSDHSGKPSGARTGRLSSNPNLQNVPKKPKYVKLPKWLADRVVNLPFMRKYIRPRKGYILLNRDYSQQELRILGHYEDNVLLQAYLADPQLDLHTYATELINNLLGGSFERKPIKNMGFGLIYGMGIAKLAASMDTDMATAKVLKKAYLQIFPGLGTLIEDLMDIGKAGEAIRTWGGREYYVEPAKYDKDKARWQTYEYKLLNVLIQGSAADCTKEAMIRVDEACPDSILILNVHDEIMLDTPKEIYIPEMARMREAMESVELDIPMLSDGKYSRSSWGDMKKFKEVA